MKSLGAARIRMQSRRPIQFGGEACNGGIVGAFVWSLFSYVRHLARPQFSDSSLPDVRVFGHFVIQDGVQIQVAFLDFRIVATDAVLANEWRQNGVRSLG